MPRSKKRQQSPTSKAKGCSLPAILGAALVPFIALFVCCSYAVLSAEHDGRGHSSKPTRKAPEKPSEISEVDAWIMAKRFVKDSLKSPSTASFGNQVCNDDTVTRTGPHSFEVRGWVDAQNSFGAQLRSRFHVKLHCDESGETWKLDEPVLLVEP